MNVEVSEFIHVAPTLTLLAKNFRASLRLIKSSDASRGARHHHQQQQRPLPPLSPSPQPPPTSLSSTWPALYTASTTASISLLGVNCATQEYQQPVRTLSTVVPQAKRALSRSYPLTKSFPTSSAGNLSVHFQSTTWQDEPTRIFLRGRRKVPRR